ncbi:MAG: hypothetical protein SF053_11390 [Bacteroidia bacterium]|nr:hypothetical protein [Bacteroidia bacterium]
MNFCRMTLWLLGAAIGWGGCQESNPATTAPTTGPAPVAQPESNTGTVSNERDRVISFLMAYYTALESEQLDETRFFAPVVRQFFNSSDIPREKVAQSLRTGFAAVENRAITLDTSTLRITPVPEGVAVDFEGSASFLRTPDRSAVQQSFRNRVVLDAEFKIVSYESVDMQLPATATRGLGQDAALSEALQIAAILLPEFKSGKFTQTPTYLHPEKGFFFIARPGVAPVPYQCTTVEDMLSYLPVLRQGLKSLGTVPLAGTLPAFSCEDGFAANGCFIGTVPIPAPWLSDMMRTLSTYGMGEYEDNSLDAARDLERYMTVQIIDTAQPVAFYLGNIQGRWYLLAVDLGTYDCSA